MTKDKSKHRYAAKQKHKQRNSAEHAHYKRHYKPFRIRHLGLILLALLIGFGSVFQLGVYFGSSQIKTASVNNATPKTSSVISVRSSHGFSFIYDNDQLSAHATEVTGQGVASVSESELRTGKPLVSVALRTNNTSGITRDLAAQLNFVINHDTSSYKNARLASPKTLSDEQVAASMYEVSSDVSFNVDVLSQTNETLGGIKTVKRVFQYSPKFGSGASRVYSVQWTGVIEDRAFSVHLQGLVDDSSVPAAYQLVFDTLNFTDSKGSAVLGLSTHSALLGLSNRASAQELADDYVIDSVSPAVVKIYHATCGTLVAFGVRLGGEGCNLSTGSGFFVSSDGYIATNGHVVSFSGKDAFINVLQSNPAVLVGFLQDVVGLSSAQINSLAQNPALFASLIVEIYDQPEESITIENESHTYFVALGNEPLSVRSSEEAMALQNKAETENLSKAKLIGMDFSSRDLYVIDSGDEAGFSSSDVALLKVTLDDTPYIELFEGAATQNLGLSIVGFPGDAENGLIDNTELSPSVTNGSISAIRKSAGGKYQLYQSDADASGGNSGGPALSSSGQALGLVTYRFKNDSTQDAAKSYIRAIEDLVALAEKNNVSFTKAGTVQSDWTDGLDLYSNNRFSKALELFENVQEEYPSHRLAGAYIENAKLAIADGRDVKDFPVVLAVGVGTALLGLIAGIVMVARHHGHHQAHKNNSLPMAAAGGANPGPPIPPQTTPVQPQATPNMPAGISAPNSTFAQSSAPQTPQVVAPTQPSPVQPSVSGPNTTPQVVVSTPTQQVIGPNQSQLPESGPNQTPPSAPVQ